MNREIMILQVLFLLTGAVIVPVATAPSTISNTENASVSTSDPTNGALSKRGGRIVGGLETPIRYFPHQVSLQLEGRHICGAAVLNSYMVLGAAHCAICASTPQLYSVRAGSAMHERGGIVVPVRRIATHAQFQQPTVMNNDVAVYALAYALPISAVIQPIPLATNTDMKDLSSSVLYVSGWGSLSQESRECSPTLRYTTLKLVEHQRCASEYANIIRITAGMMCAGSMDGSRDSCEGDSGGPLVGKLRGRLRLVGIVSFGVGCAHAQFPGIYTRVDAYSDWIKRAATII